MRADFFRRHPFPELPAFKKQCGFWLRDIASRGFAWTRTPDAVTVHAPHPGYRFIAWRAWTAGLDRDFQVFHTVSRSRAGRIGYAFYFFASKLGRSWTRILRKGGEVGLSLWRRPLAMGLATGYFSILFAGELTSAVSRRFAPMAEVPPRSLAGAAPGA